MTTHDKLLDELINKGMLQQVSGEQPVLTRVFIFIPTWNNWERVSKEKREPLAMQPPKNEIYTNLLAMVENRGKGVKEFKIINPLPDDTGIWEIKGTSTRVFGFFYKKGVFIATNVEMKKNLKSGKIKGRYALNPYERFKNEVRWARKKHFEGSYVVSENIDDLL